MNGSRWWPGLLASLIFLGACDRTTAPDSAADGGAGAAAGSIEGQLVERYGEMGEVRYFDATADLDGDGQDEVIVHVVGPMLCGTGGCTTLVFTPGEGRWEPVAEISVSRPPIRVSARESNGWRNLIVHVAGGGLGASYDAELAFDGTTYPDNPTVPPATKAPDLEGAEVLIPEFESFQDGRPLTAP